MNVENNLKEELDRRRRATWAEFRPLREATYQLADPNLRGHLFDSTVLPALCYAAETLSMDQSGTKITPQASFLGALPTLMCERMEDGQKKR
ncbi:hypothetical protein ANCCEY_08517 [Ancylostoma ceylanicum]|uniref:Uncharacterized protein n=1 Tax=Ancylostoma ceylanicum TaxID=53326 RepID=A0A0D6LKC3_9BILA|nr:hypothetical protein ANCCEY_08517 [Ancylostoma ceylanicum]